MLLWKSAAIAVAVLFIAFIVNRFAPTKRKHVRRAVMTLLAFGVALGSAALLDRVGEPSWALTMSAVADILAAINIISALRLLAFDLILSRLRLEPPAILVELLMAVAYIATTLVVLRRAGLELSGIITTSAVVTGILALSLQATLGNVIGGLALQADESLRVGDWLQLENGKRGIVTKIGWRHIVLETNDWDTMIVPNAALLGSMFTILGKRDGERVPHRMWVYFNVDFRYSPSHVITTVEQALRNAPIEGVVADPKPSCVCMNFAETGRDSMAYYGARYWLTDMHIDDPTNSRVRTLIYAALRRADIPLAVPAAHVWVEQDSEERRERKRQRGLQRRLDALRCVPFLLPLDDDERMLLAEHLGYVPFAPGEIVTRQGAIAHYLYIIVEGDVEVRVYSGDAYELVSTVSGPGFVGEMGLMTGAPRMATVVAKNDVQCYRLDKVAFEKVLGDRPEMAGQISEILAQRAVELKAAQEDLDQESRRGLAEAEKSRLLKSIREFFGLDES